MQQSSPETSRVYGGSATEQRVTEQMGPSFYFLSLWRRVTTVPSVTFIGFTPGKEEERRETTGKERRRQETQSEVLRHQSFSVSFWNLMNQTTHTHTLPVMTRWVYSCRQILGKAPKTCICIPLSSKPGHLWSPVQTCISVSQEHQSSQTWLCIPPATNTHYEEEHRAASSDWRLSHGPTSVYLFIHPSRSKTGESFLHSDGTGFQTSWKIPVPSPVHKDSRSLTTTTPGLIVSLEGPHNALHLHNYNSWQGIERFKEQIFSSPPQSTLCNTHPL